MWIKLKNKKGYLKVEHFQRLPKEKDWDFAVDLKVGGWITYTITDKGPSENEKSL